MLTNTSLEDAVLDSLGRDPRIPDSADIAVIWDTAVPSDSIDVKVDDGWIRLKGDVGYHASGFRTALLDEMGHLESQRVGR